MDFHTNTLYITGSAHSLYPADLLFGLLKDGKGQCCEIPKRYPFKGSWGQPLSTHILDNIPLGCPKELDIVWLSVIEKTFYSYNEELPIELLANELSKGDYTHLVIGMGYGGTITLWLWGNLKSIVVLNQWCKTIEIDMADFLPLSPDIKLETYCRQYIEAESDVYNNLVAFNGLPPRDLFDNYMKQFIYRYQVLLEKWNGKNEDIKWEKYKEDEVAVEIDYIEESLYDGTHDKLHDGGLMKYHEAGKPKKLKVQMYKGKNEWSAYFWFDEDKICEVFNRFYGAHPDTKTDFIIRIDAEQNKYELAMYRYGLKEPVIIKPDVYQLIVFKNKFECYRSENYDQPRGAWIW